MLCDFCHIGTSGWAYPEWRGKFYPRFMRDRDRLAYYAQQFDTVEVNGSFYQLPKPDLMERWRDMVPDHFRFTLKIWRAVTHVQKLRNARADLDQFLASIEPLREKTGPLLLQLPPNLDASAAADLSAVLGVISDKGWNVAVEFRHRSWAGAGTEAILKHDNAAMVLHDRPRGIWTDPNEGASFVYLRYHGPLGDYKGGYAPEFLAAEAARIAAWNRAGKKIWAFFNNTSDGSAPENARALRDKLNQPSTVTSSAS